MIGRTKTRWRGPGRGCPPIGFGVLMVCLFLPVGTAWGAPGDLPGQDFDERDANRHILRLTDFLAQMEEDLYGLMGDNWSCGLLQAEFPDMVDAVAPDFQTAQSLSLLDGEDEIAAGTSQVTIHQSDGRVDFMMELQRPDDTKRWELTQTVRLDGDVLSMWGSVTVFEVGPAPITYVGGWTCSTADGPQEHPDSDPGFHDEAAAMFGCMAAGSTANAGPAAGDAAEASSPDRGYGIESIVQTISGVLSLNVYALLDAVAMPAGTSGSCKGPKISNGPGQSCNGVDIPCQDEFPVMCKKIDQLPKVSWLFRNCMKGRCGCGGSWFRRATITCDTPYPGCGPCGSYPGCAPLFGNRIYYCSGTPVECTCVDIVFHEMSHTCGALDRKDGSAYDAYRIGDWFEAGCPAREGTGENRATFSARALIPAEGGSQE